MRLGILNQTSIILPRKTNLLVRIWIWPWTFFSMEPKIADVLRGLFPRGIRIEIAPLKFIKKLIRMAQAITRQWQKYHKCMQTLKEASQKDSGHQPLSSEPAHQSRLSWFSRLVGCFYLSALCSWPTQTRSPFLDIFWGWKPSRWISEGRCHHEVLDEQKHLRREQRSISTVSSPVWVLRRKL